MRREQYRVTLTDKTGKIVGESVKYAHNSGLAEGRNIVQRHMEANGFTNAEVWGLVRGASMTEQIYLMVGGGRIAQTVTVTVHRPAPLSPDGLAHVLGCAS